MNRRGFIQISSVAILPLLLGAFPKARKKKKYSVSVQSNRKFGHIIRETMRAPISSEKRVRYVIIGGGIAGMAAATELKGEDFVLLEADDRLGGSSGSSHWKDTVFSTGAHYDLAYPSSYGKEVIALLKQMDVVYFNKENQLYEFVDQQYLIKEKEAEQCFVEGGAIDEILSEVDGLDEFRKVLKPFEGKMLLPTRLIDVEFHYLNELTFETFLRSKLKLTKELKARIDYQMIDDWGATSDQVSALAGIHYYVCRPYDKMDVQLFSPPQGNSYFIEKMVGEVDSSKIQVNALVRSIQETKTGVEIEVISENRTIQKIQADKVLYAGQKHALKYMLATKEPLFENNYAPWVVVNFVCEKGIEFSAWQNDVLTKELTFLGFVNSSKQHSRSEKYDVFTAYYCMSEDDRNRLVVIEENPEAFIDRTIELIEDSTNTLISGFLVHANIKLMGHAMPIPKPGYLNFDSPLQYSENITFAGVDTGRLPLFYEACDSGIQAARKLKMNKENS
ncbi:MAG: FAD-dependent oxidoreductase [Crocinitomicaceae bacterium]|nr:FAD-dependent oxidoreductase [Crocinitomicaceae bacterium]